MPIFRKKLIEIEAYKCIDILHTATHDWENLPSCIRKAYEQGEVLFEFEQIYIKTLEGNMIALKDDWIIKGVFGELYPCKPDVFQETYEVVL